MSKKKVHPLYLDKEVVELLKVQAEKNDRSVSAEANRILKQSLQSK